MSTPSDRSPNRKTGPPASGWFPTDNAVADRVAEIGLAAFAFYSILRRHSEIDGNGKRFTTRKAETLARYLGVSQRYVRTLAGDLEKAGLIMVEKRRGEGGKHRANTYHFPNTTPPKTTGTIVPSATGTIVHPFQEPSLFFQEPSCSQEREPAKAGAPSKGLLELIDDWNSLGDSIVRAGNGARRNPPARAVLAGWNRAVKKPEQREAFRDIPKVILAIRGATFCHGQGWFTLPWLFGKNRNGEFNAMRLLAGAYERNANGKLNPNADPGSTYIHGAAGPGIGDI